jgi:4-amino-4-deoxy-L-arabinose transferase-like glycosyltransferase
MVMNTSAAGNRESVRITPFAAACCLYAAVVTAITVACRLRLLSVPLERDEGGFAYVGQQILRGIPPYESGNSMKLPGIHFAYALIMSIFGETAAGIHCGLLLCNLGSVLLLLLLARRVMSVEGAVIAAGVYALLSISMNVLGVFAHATHFVVFFVLAGTLALMAGVDRGRTSLVLTGGICMGLSVGMKQNGIFFCLFAAGYLLTALLRRSSPPRAIAWKCGMLGLGMALPHLVIMAYLLAHGVLAEYWFWTVDYVWEYASSSGLRATLLQFFWQLHKVASSAALLWLIGGGGVIMLLSRKVEAGSRTFLLAFSAISFVSIWPGSHFYEHYFVLFLPALALLVGWGPSVWSRSEQGGMPVRARRWLCFGVLIIATASFLYQERHYLFTADPVKVSRMLYYNNPFTESPVIAEYIRNNSRPGDTIAVLGSEPQIYFYADRPSASDYLFMYCLTQTHPYAAGMQREMMAEIEAGDPEFIVVVAVDTSWLFEQNSETMLVDWATGLLSEKYRKVGLADMHPHEETVYYWGEKAEKAAPRSEFFVSIYRKNSPGPRCRGDQQPGRH